MGSYDKLAAQTGLTPVPIFSQKGLIFILAFEGAFQVIEKIGAPYGTRTHVTAVKGRRPRPLDEGRGIPAEAEAG
jgi:hypothetical protein